MSHHYKSPTMTIGPEVMSPYLNSSLRHVSPKAWCPPLQHWYTKNRTPPQGNRNPYYNQCHSPNGYWGSPRQWSPNRWESSPNCQRSWGSSPRLPYTSDFRYSPLRAQVYSERKDIRTQVPFKQRRGSNINISKNISQYYSSCMVEDPWAEFEDKDTKSTPQNPAKACHTFVAGSHL